MTPLERIAQYKGQALPSSASDGDIVRYWVRQSALAWMETERPTAFEPLSYIVAPNEDVVEGFSRLLETKSEAPIEGAIAPKFGDLFGISLSSGIVDALWQVELRPTGFTRRPLPDRPRMLNDGVFDVFTFLVRVDAKKAFHWLTSAVESGKLDGLNASAETPALLRLLKLTDLPSDPFGEKAKLDNAALSWAISAADYSYPVRANLLYFFERAVHHFDEHDYALTVVNTIRDIDRTVSGRYFKPKKPGQGIAHSCLNDCYEEKPLSERKRFCERVRSRSKSATMVDARFSWDRVVTRLPPDERQRWASIPLLHDLLEE